MGTEIRSGRGLSRAKFGVVCALAGALVAGPMIAGAYTIGARTAADKAVTAVVGAGVMTPLRGGFHPSDPATRGTVALALHRSIPRISIQPELSSMSDGVTADLGDVKMTVDGAAHHFQQVLISVQMQLDHDNALGSGCTASWTLTRDAAATVLGNWSQEFYTGTTGEEYNIAFSFLVSQPTNTTSTYHLNGSQACGQTLFTDQDIMTAQTFALRGNGTFRRTGRVLSPAAAVPGHDR
jgi:hypothetical protein